MTGKAVVFVAFIVLFWSFFVQPSDGFCGNHRLLFGQLSRSSMRAAEFVRNKLMNKNVFTDDGIQGHNLGVILHSLRLAGFTLDMLSKLTVGKTQFENIVNNLNTSAISAGQAAYYLYGSLAVCQDPQEYSGLVNKLKNGIPTYPNIGQFNHPFQYGLAVLALCMSGNGQSSFPQYAVKLKQLIVKSSALSHSPVNTLGLLTMALTCIYTEDDTLKNDKSVKNTIAHSVKNLIGKGMKRDGSFGGSIATTIAVQTLLTIKKTDLNVDMQQWNCKKTMKVLLSRQAGDGSFVTFLTSTARVLPALFGAIPRDIPQNVKCPAKPKPTEKMPIRVCIGLEFITPIFNCTLPPNPPPQYMTIDVSDSVHHVLKVAATMHLCYNFVAKKYAYGHSLRSICGVERDSTRKKYWSSYFRPMNATWTDQDVKGTTGMDRLRLKDGWCIIYKYRQFYFR